jgi:hypothetical protein
VNKGSCTAAAAITSVCMSVSIIDMLTAHLKKLLNWKVSEVKIFYTNLGNCMESKGASKNKGISMLQL